MVRVVVQDVGGGGSISKCCTCTEGTRVHIRGTIINNQFIYYQNIIIFSDYLFNFVCNVICTVGMCNVPCLFVVPSGSSLDVLLFIHVVTQSPLS